MTFEQWFNEKDIVAEYLQLDLEKSFRDFARDAWEVAFEAGENVACEGAYDDGHREAIVREKRTLRREQQEPTKRVMQMGSKKV